MTLISSVFMKMTLRSFSKYYSSIIDSDMKNNWFSLFSRSLGVQFHWVKCSYDKWKFWKRRGPWDHLMKFLKPKILHSDFILINCSDKDRNKKIRTPFTIEHTLLVVDGRCPSPTSCMAARIFHSELLQFLLLAAIWIQDTTCQLDHYLT